MDAIVFSFSQVPSLAFGVLIKNVFLFIYIFWCQSVCSNPVTLPPFSRLPNFK